MAIEIAPSILSCDPADFATPVREMAAAGVDWIHLDVMDGQFVPPITFGADLARSLTQLTPVPTEAHLMTLTPEAHFSAFIAAGCRRIIFHAEATSHSHRLAQSLRSAGVQAGLAINPGTPLSVVEPVADQLDLLLIMTVNPGWGGQALIPACIDKVRQARAAFPGLSIEVDGGIDPDSIREVANAGANVFVVGSYLMRAPSIAKGVEELRAR